MAHNAANPQVRAELKNNNIPFWVLANKINVHESTVIRWFRTELTPAQATLVWRGLKEIIEERSETSGE